MTEGAGRVRRGKTPIHDAAIRLFKSRGYHGTSMRDIAREAGINVASIYHHFGSKQEILQEVMVRMMTDVISVTRAAVLAADPEPDKQLAALVHAWVLFHADHQQEAMIGGSELRSLDDDGRQRVVALRDEQQRLFDEVIARGVDQRTFHTAHPKEASRAVINMGHAVASWYSSDGEIPPEHMAQRYVELALATVGCMKQE
ncbi:TetR family transcriptional regulator [Saccharomonospora sp. CUA-673]|uniref:TetR/AcrR family transcriptional regulator n=1 Tax=Saccharomonospora sp. CUA-673 TaxID=1904969 RepID=UPI00095CB372|nr:TetR/AcrR family transcriptional regulator [Saccharomonospora sp. CUA-673]OLT45468.1 TetR family transcriptional regulator [Saccharomonospora sp. CUA-673]